MTMINKPNGVGRIYSCKGKAIRCDGITHSCKNLIRRGKMKLYLYMDFIQKVIHKKRDRK